MYIGPWQEYALSRLRSTKIRADPDSPRSRAAGVADLEAIKTHLEQNLKTKLSADELKQLVDTLSPLVQKTPMQDVYDLKLSNPTQQHRPPPLYAVSRNFSGPSSVSSDQSSFGTPSRNGSYQTSSHSTPANQHRTGKDGLLLRELNRTSRTSYSQGRPSSRASRGSQFSSQSEPAPNEQAYAKAANRPHPGLRRRRPDEKSPPDGLRASSDGASTRPPLNHSRTGQDASTRTSYDGQAAAAILKVARQKRELLNPDFKSMWKWANTDTKDSESRTESRESSKKIKKKKKKKKSTGLKPKEVLQIEKMKKAWKLQAEAGPTAITQETIQKVLRKGAQSGEQSVEQSVITANESSSEESDEDEESSEEEQADPTVSDIALTEDHINMVAKYFGGNGGMTLTKNTGLSAIPEAHSPFEKLPTLQKQLSSMNKQNLSPSINIQVTSKSIDVRNTADAPVSMSPPASPMYGESGDFSADALVNWTRNLNIDGIL